MKLDGQDIQDTVFACGEGFVTMTIPMEIPAPGDDFPHPTVKIGYIAQLSPAYARLFAEKLTRMADTADNLRKEFEDRNAIVRQLTHTDAGVPAAVEPTP
jgi:hypothetical protein